jgi:hypothetical protein
VAGKGSKTTIETEMGIAQAKKIGPQQWKFMIAAEMGELILEFTMPSLLKIACGDSNHTNLLFYSLLEHGLYFVVSDGNKEEVDRLRNVFKFPIGFQPLDPVGMIVHGVNSARVSVSPEPVYHLETHLSRIVRRPHHCD